jgi:VIT1/CCC1 family predicted Fe2+/Mn2+ transporter
MPGMEIPFVTRHLSAGERLGELLFGLIMTLSFTLTAGFVVGVDNTTVRELLVAIIGCNLAWGIIDGGLLVLGRAFDRGRYARVGQAIRQSPGDEQAIAAVAAELDEILEPLAGPDARRVLYSAVAKKVRSTEHQSHGVRSEDWPAAFAVFLVVASTSIPAALPFLVIEDHLLALRVSNLILIGLLFVIGYHWASYTSINPWRAALVLTAFGMTMVGTAIALGG